MILAFDRSCLLRLGGSLGNLMAAGVGGPLDAENPASYCGLNLGYLVKTRSAHCHSHLTDL